MENLIKLKLSMPELSELAQAILKLAGAEAQSPVQEAPEQTPVGNVNPVPVQTMVPTSPLPATAAAPQTIAPAASPVPVAPAQPVAVPTNTVPTTPVPTTAVPITHTQDELAIAASQLVNMGKQQRLIEILNGFGVNSLVELPTEKYSAFAGCLKQEGAQF